MSSLLIRVDGGASPNPGHGACAAAAYSIEQNGAVLRPVGTRARYLGSATSNNEAEHEALISALELALELREEMAVSVVVIESDSRLTVNHFNKTWDVQSPKLRERVERQWSLAEQLRPVVHWVPRDTVHDAHDLVQGELDAYRGVPIAHEVTPRSQLTDDVSTLLEDESVTILSKDWVGKSLYGIQTPKAFLALLHFYCSGPHGIHASVEERYWRELTALALSQPVVVVWRPLGNQLVAVPAAQVYTGDTVRPTRDLDGGVEPLMAFSETLRLGEAVTRVVDGKRTDWFGYSGTRIHYLEGGPWIPAREFFWHA